MDKEFFHHPGLQRSHGSIQVINNLRFYGFEVMSYDFLLIHIIILRPVNEFSRKEICQDAPCAFVIDVRYGARQLDVCPLQHLLKQFNSLVRSPTKLFYGNGPVFSAHPDQNLEFAVLPL